MDNTPVLQVVFVLKKQFKQKRISCYKTFYLKK